MLKRVIMYNYNIVSAMQNKQILNKYDDHNHSDQ